MVYVTSDLHGFPLVRIRALLDKVEFSDEDFLFVLGDVIDRGEQGIEILKWLLYQPNAQLILGNHEAMMLACSFLFEEITDQSIAAFDQEKMALLTRWQKNGAEPTMHALSRETPEMRADILEYLREAPLYEAVNVNGRDFLLTHSGLGNYRADKKLREYTPDELFWTRPHLGKQYSHEFTTVFGHTPTCCYGDPYKGKMIVTDTWINIDTGVAFGHTPMLLRLDDLKPFYMDEIS